MLKKIAKFLYDFEAENKKAKDAFDRRVRELEDEVKEYTRYEKTDKTLKDFHIDINSFIEKRDYLSEYEPKERREMLGMASAIYCNKAFGTVIDALMNIHASHSILQAPNAEVIAFDRAGIYAMQLLKEEFKRLDGIYKDMTKPDEDYDKHDVI